MLLLDLTHTSHTTARTGIQRVCRSLHATLAEQTDLLAVTHDPFQGGWRELAAWERGNLASDNVAPRRAAQWPLSTRWGGRVNRWLGRGVAPLPVAAEGVLVPEIFSPGVATALPALFAAGRPRVALFHDAIPLRLPEMTPGKTVSRFPAYLQELRRFDGVAAVSADSCEALVDYWRWLGGPAGPPVIALPLGVDPPARVAPAPACSGQTPVVLCVGSIEGRKNHLALLRACERLWDQGAVFSLHLIGLPRPETAREALALIRQLQAQQRPLRFDGAVDDDALRLAYDECDFTVYPSLMEGFGLPVIESLQHGRPCICSARGALGESANGGGCLTLDAVDAESLAHAIHTLLTDTALRHRLGQEAAARPLRSWRDYGAELLQWMATLPRG